MPARIPRAGLALATAGALALPACGSSVDAADSPDPPVPSTSATSAPSSAAPTTSPAEESTAPPSPATHALGDPVPFSGTASGTVTVHETRRMTEWEFDWQAPENGDSWLVADISVTVDSVAGDDPLWVTVFDFSVQDPAGRVYAGDLTPLGQHLDGQITSGRKVRGEVAFDAPTGAPLLLDWSPGLSGPVATWEVPQ